MSYATSKLTDCTPKLSTSIRRYASIASSRIAQVSPILLRDACRCTQCIDPSTQQREFTFSDIPTDIQVISVDRVADDTYEVRWQSDIPGLTDHVSCYSEAQLSRVLRGNSGLADKNRSMSLWDKTVFEEETEHIDFSRLMKDDASLSRALELVQRHGLVFIKSIPEDPDAVRKIVNRLALLKNTFYGETWDVRSVPQAKNVAYTSKILGYHMDLLYMKEPPGLQLLHSLQNSCTGGESEFADTFKAIDILKQEAPEHIDILTKAKIKYGYDNDGFYYSDEKPVIKIGAQYHLPPTNIFNASDAEFMQSVERVYWSPPFIDTISGASQDISQFVKAAKAFCDVLHRPELTYETKMEAGTCAVFDNLRVVHARKAFDVNSGKRWLKGVYGDQQDVLSKSVKHVWSQPRV